MTGDATDRAETRSKASKLYAMQVERALDRETRLRNARTVEHRDDVRGRKIVMLHTLADRLASELDRPDDAVDVDRARVLAFVLVDELAELEAR